MTKNKRDVDGIGMSWRKLRWRSDARVTTNLRPKALWGSGPGRNAKTHMVYSAFAEWDNGHPVANAVARCGNLMHRVRFAMTPELDREICDECLLADYRPETVYRLFNAAGELLYVGYTFNPIARIKGHRRESYWGSEIASVRLEFFDSEKLARSAEARIINDEKPLHNLQWLHPLKGGPRLRDRAAAYRAKRAA